MTRGPEVTSARADVNPALGAGTQDGQWGW
jgi:hypothetical protein